MSLIDIEIQASNRSDVDCDNYEDMNTLLAKDDFIESRCGEILMSRCKILLFRCCECRESFLSYEEFFNHLCEQHATVENEIKSEPKDDEHLLDVQYYDEDNLIIMNESEEDVKPSLETTRSPKKQIIEKDVFSVNELSQDYEIMESHNDDGEISIQMLQQCYENFEELDTATVDSDGKSHTYLNDFSKFLDHRNIDECNIEDNNSREPIQSPQSEKSESCDLDSATDDKRCKTCGKMFESRRKVLIHMKNHDKARRFKCHICGFAFTEQFNLRSHLKRHSGTKQFECNLCDKKFMTKTELNAHTRIHTGERPFVCEICGNSYVTSGSLNEHRKRHNNYRPHKCTMCEKSFFDSGLLKEHMVVHTGERSHVCNLCDSKFTRRKALLQHMKLHSGVKQYECIYCEKAFAQKPGLASHLKTHRKLNIEGDGTAIEYCE